MLRFRKQVILKIASNNSVHETYTKQLKNAYSRTKKRRKKQGTLE